MIDTPSPDQQRVLEVLRASGVFGGLPDQVLQDLAAELKVQFVPGGDIVYREGDQAHSMFFLVSGRLRVSRRDKNGALQRMAAVQKTIELVFRQSLPAIQRHVFSGEGNPVTKALFGQSIK